MHTAWWESKGSLAIFCVVWGEGLEVNIWGHLNSELLCIDKISIVFNSQQLSRVSGWGLLPITWPFNWGLNWRLSNTKTDVLPWSHTPYIWDHTHTQKWSGSTENGKDIIFLHPKKLSAFSFEKNCRHFCLTLIWERWCWPDKIDLGATSGL